MKTHTKMTLGDVIAALRELPEGAKVRGFDLKVDSYRGYYERNAVVQSSETHDAFTAAELLEVQEGDEITGYKGGYYTVSLIEGLYLVPDFSATGPCFAGFEEVEPGIFEPIVVDDGGVW